MVGFCFTTVIIVTFDGYANHYDRAARILSSLGIPSIFFITTRVR
jgi:peptidoglycan/xylan/chitin deacetylase (PgdA/CDA1 family)